MINNYRKNTNLSIRIDEEDKKQFTDIVGEIGLSPTNAINIFIKTVIKDKSLAPLFTYKVPVFDEQNTGDSRKQKREAFEKFFDKIEKNTQEELDDISEHRVNITRELDL